MFTLHEFILHAANPLILRMHDALPSCFIVGLQVGADDSQEQRHSANDMFKATFEELLSNRTAAS